jgi:2-dehydropantoate 2-reductase
MWRKAIFNCVINPTTSLLRSEVGAIVDPKLNSLKRQIIDECLAVAKADGVTFEEDFIALIDRVFAGARTIASMQQDLMKGRKTEIDHMNGAVVELAVRFGIACPVNAAMTTMIRYLESRADA